MPAVLIRVSTEKIEAAISYLDDVGSLNCAFQGIDCLSHIPDGKGSSDKKFISNHQTFSTGGCGQLDMRLGLFTISNIAAIQIGGGV